MQLQSAQKYNKQKLAEIDNFAGRAPVADGDAESPATVEQGPQIIYNLPWEGLREDQAKHLTKEVFSLSKDEDALLAQEEELEYKFDFDVD